MSIAHAIEINVLPMTATKTESDSVTFECIVQGTEQNSTWIRKRTGWMVGGGKFLHLRNILLNDSDIYCCEVKVSRGIVVRSCGRLTVGKYSMILEWRRRKAENPCMGQIVQVLLL